MTLESIHPLVQWIAAHPLWSGLIVFIISLSESLAVVGLVVPGVILMTAIGSLIGAGKLPAVATMTWAMLGAVAGDGISYWLGHHYRGKLKYLWPFNKFPNLLRKGNVFFKDHGGKSIILGRFIGPIRPTIPVIAGIMGMTPRTFLFFNVASAVVWAPLYSLPGILIGVSLGQLSPKVASAVLSLVLGILFILWLAFYLILKIILYVKRLWSKFFRKMWVKWYESGRVYWLNRLLITAVDKKKGQLGTTFIFIVAMAAFCFILSNIHYEEGLAHWNELVYQFFRVLYTNVLANWAIIILSLGSPTVFFATTSIVGIYLFKKHRITSICWFGAIIIGCCILQYYKLSITSVRPEGLVQAPFSNSFPSRHVFFAVLMYGLTASIARQVFVNKYRRIIWFISFLIILLISFSSLYLSLNWFTDVIGSLFLGIAIVAFGVFIYRRFVVSYVSLKDLLLPFCIALLISSVLYNVYSFKECKNNWKRQWLTQTLNVNEWWKTGPIVESKHNGCTCNTIKDYTIPLDLQWLGNLNEISDTLYGLGWMPLHRLTFESSLTLLSGKTSANLLPVLPKFHRDRLPSLVLSKIVDENSKRLVLRLWASDYITTNGLPLWVGTVRLESIEMRIPFLTFYMEWPNNLKKNTYTTQLINSFRKERAWKYKKMSNHYSSYSIFLIAPR